MENQSQSIAKLTEALCKAQSLIEGAKKDSSNPYFKSDYADLTSVWKACKRPLTDNGLAIIQTMETKDQDIILVTTLAHSSGEWIKSFLPVVMTKRDPQSVGSAITYSRRFALAAIAGVCPYNEDDDAEEAMEEVRKEPVKEVSKKLTEVQKQELQQMLKGDPEAEGRIKKARGLASVYDLKPEDFNGIIAHLKQRKTTLVEA
jgi:hypothetical protein